MPRHTGRHDKARDHHHPDDGGRGRAPVVVGALGEQHQQRRTGSADPCPDQAEGENRERDAEQPDA